MTEDRERTYKDGLLKDEGTGKAVAVDRVDTDALSHIHVPHIDRSPSTEMPSLPPAVKMPNSTQELGAMVAVGDFRAVGPEMLLRLLSQAHADYFSADFRQATGEFVKLRYHLGEANEAWELHSDSFALDVDSWTPMKEQIVEHIRSNLSDVDLERLGKIAVRMVYFHDARIRAQDDSQPDALCHPLDFGCWLTLTVGEFAEYVMEGHLPEEVRIGFDAGYHHLGDDTAKAFGYVKHWRFFAEVLFALSKTLGHPLDKRDPVLELLLTHTREDLADMVLGLGIHDRRSFESTDRVYRPRVEAIFRAEQLTVHVEDPQGIMRLYAMDLPVKDYKRSIHGNRVTLQRHHPG